MAFTFYLFSLQRVKSYKIPDHCQEILLLDSPIFMALGFDCCSAHLATTARLIYLSISILFPSTFDLIIPYCLVRFWCFAVASVNHLLVICFSDDLKVCFLYFLWVPGSEEGERLVHWSNQSLWKTKWNVLFLACKGLNACYKSAAVEWESEYMCQNPLGESNIEGTI